MITKSENTHFIYIVDNISVIEFDWGSTDLETIRMDREGHDRLHMVPSKFQFEAFFIVNFSGLVKVTIDFLDN